MDRKREIIDALLKLASENGLGSVSMQQIADKVGITKASLYNHFSSKEEIVDKMYGILRENSKRSLGIESMNFDMMNGVPLNEILYGMVSSYKKMCLEPEMFMFYKIIMSERTINKAAAEIMVSETNTMINATKILFYALHAKNIASFKEVDSAAFAFAMAVHSIIDYECDMMCAGIQNDRDFLREYVDSFCAANTQ